MRVDSPARERFDRPFEESLRRHESAGLLRVEEVIDKPDARRARLAGGRICVDFSSNSYLGLHERVASRAIRKFPRAGSLTSAGSSRMVSGTRPLHRQFEESLADFLGAESSAVFGSGFLSCASTVSTLAGPRDRILYDEKCHASLRAGVQMSGAVSLAYRHASTDDLEEKLRKPRAHGRTYILTDGLFSMDGDFAPLDRISALGGKYGACLIVDDAHGIGVVGSAGRGSFEKFGIRPGPGKILLGTLSKAFASYGGFVAATRAVIRYLKARSREFIYTTGAPPFQIVAASVALAVIRSREGQRLREKLRRNAAELGRALGRPVNSPIISIRIPGGSAAVLAAARALREKGVLAFGIRYPTVPRGEEMIRVSLSAAHTPADIRHLAVALKPLAA
ncbi:pyridoxal phosphate-dependent aminotransferase family protein [bacterium]|nr:pyridoxal phosphate-dependent aminotransferase family protein [bacterium]